MRLARQFQSSINAATPESISSDVHLIESFAWPGESGSPVYLYEETHKALPPEGRIGPETRPTLIGLLHGHMPIEYYGQMVNSGIAVVVPIKNLYELLQDPGLIAEREDIDKEVGRKLQPSARPSSAN